MEKIKNINIPKSIFFEPCTNLPGKAADPDNDESRFTIKFTHSYLQQFRFLHHKTSKTSIICAREIQINGFGIADLITIAWDPSRINNAPITDDTILITKPTVRAYEFKLSNWRRALMQASRYKYFAHVSTVVLPLEKCDAPLKYLDTFKKIRIGLWGFDVISNKIIPFFSPKPKKPLDLRYQRQALEIVTSVSKTQRVS